MSASSTEGSLHGVRVLDLTQHVAGPYCTRLLAGLGADVLKIEPPGGDPTRGIGPHSGRDESREHGAMFLYLNQGKRSITLDLDVAADHERLAALVRRADVLVESFPASLSARWGLSYRDLAAVNPALVVAAVSALGGEGPYRDFEAPEIVIHALGGLLWLTGSPDKAPLCPGGFQASYLAGASAAVGTLIALWHARRAGHGQQVDVAAMEALASALEGALGNAAAGVMRVRRGNRQGDDLPMSLLPCADGYVLVGLASESDWEAFTYFVADERLRAASFATADARRQNAAALDAILGEWLRGMTRADFFAAAQEWRFPCAPVLAPEELPADPQHAARQFFARIDHPVAGQACYPGAPFRMSATPWQARRAPLIAEHDGRIADWDGCGACEEASSQARCAVDWASPAALDSSALAGLRIVDLTSMWAGPYCTRLLADAGAEVIKVELPSRPDGTRRGKVLAPGGAVAPFFQELNRNKYGVTLDLRSATDRARLLHLVARSDAVVENFSPRVMRNLALEYEALRAVKPDLVMLSMPAFGASGPYRHAVAFGSGIEAASGLAATTGYPEGPPALLGVAYGDPVAGLHGAVALLAALEHRRRTGEGQHVELAQREALTQFIGEIVVGQSIAASPVARLGNRHPYWAPQGCYRCLGEDRWIAISVTDEGQWRRLCAVIGWSAWSTDPRFAGPARRRARHDEIDAAVENWTRHQEHREAMRALQSAGVPAGAVLDPRELLADPHLSARSFLTCPPAAAGAPLELGAAVSSIAWLPGPLCKLSATPLHVLRPAPALGEHNALPLPWHSSC